MPPKKAPRLKKDGTPYKKRKDKGVSRGPKKTSEQKAATRIARPVNRRIIRIEQVHPRPVADATLRQIENGINKLLLTGPPAVKAREKRENTSDYLTWWSKYSKTRAYQLDKVNYPDRDERMRYVGALYRTGHVPKE
jgi:hypothetical protein